MLDGASSLVTVCLDFFATDCCDMDFDENMSTLMLWSTKLMSITSANRSGMEHKRRDEKETYKEKNKS